MEDAPNAIPMPTHAPASSTETPELVGFIVSLIGIALCGILSPIGMMLSYAEMRRRPNGFAKAGFVLGLIGTILLVLSVVLFITVVASVRSQMDQMHSLLDQMDQSVVATELVRDFVAQNDRLPSPQEAQVIFSQLGDHGKSLTFKPGKDGSFTIIDSGPDGQIGTNDDLEIPGYAAIRFRSKD